MKRRLTGILSAAIVALTWVPATPARAATDHPVVLVAFQYVPSGSTVGGAGLAAAGFGQPVVQGDKITFTNLDPLPHSVAQCDGCGLGLTPTPTPGGFDSGIIPLTRSWQLDTTTLAAGTYTYYCKIAHPYMRGSFTVVAP